jgi:hypothetical protein
MIWVLSEEETAMTPEERNLVIDLFDRLATLEDAQRDPEAERLIRDGLRQAPNALYALVQTVLVQDEALKRADARIRELEGAAEPAARDTSFLGNMRDSLLGRNESRGSVPSVPPREAVSGTSPAWRSAGEGMPTGPISGPRPATMGGSSFLGTAAAAAAGAIGGSLLLGGIRNAMASQPGHSAFDAGSSGAESPKSGGTSDSELSRQAGLDDIGQTHSSASGDTGGGSGYGLFDDNNDDEGQAEHVSDDLDDGSFDSDFDC